MCNSCKEVETKSTSQRQQNASAKKHHWKQRNRNLTVQLSCAKKKHANALFARSQFMRSNGESNSDARLAYELHLGKRVSDNHWYKVKRNLEDGGFEVTADTAVFYAKLKQHLPRTSVGTLEVFKHYQKAEKLLAESASKITGIKILEILSNQGINPHASTISRWFKPLGGFRKTRLYFPEKLTPVLTAAFIYQTVNSPKLGA